MRGVALGGFMGVGKTEVGRRLGEILGLPVVDLDEVLTERFGPIAQQFAEEGEPAFRSRERALIAELADGVPRVIATGGGAWVDPLNREILARHHLLAVLTARPETIARRVGSGAGRPLWSEGAAALLEGRREAYADCHVSIATDGRSVEQVATLLVERVEGRLGRDPSGVWVPLGRRSYPVAIREDFEGLREALARLGRTEIAVVADPRAGALHGEALRAELGPVRWIELTGGESHKTPQALIRLLDDLLVAGFTRKTTLVAFGGGVTGDLVGLAAALALRGVGWIQVPTTLLAMVDSSVGGKTAVNTSAGKNLIGAFAQPELVWAALSALDTLPPEEWACGLGEVLKTAVVGDPALLDQLERIGPELATGRAPRRTVAELVRRCVEIKAGVVGSDERESGRRAWLNLGHTVAHGLERALGADRITHGQAVAVGMVAEARWALRTGRCLDPALPPRIERVARAMGLPTELPVTEHDAVLDAMRLDKKASSDRLVLPIPVRAGVVSLADIPIDALHELLDPTG